MYLAGGSCSLSVHGVCCRDGEEERRGNSILNRSEVDLAFALFSGALAVHRLPCPPFCTVRPLAEVPRIHPESLYFPHSSRAVRRGI